MDGGARGLEGAEPLDRLGQRPLGHALATHPGVGEQLRRLGRQNARPAALVLSGDVDYVPKTEEDVK